MDGFSETMSKALAKRAAVRRVFIYEPPRDPFLQVIYQDDELLVVDKPSGLLSVPGKAAGHEDCLEARAQAHITGARIVHRLDNATSGVMVLAKTKAAHRHLSMQFERRHTAKVYIARVWGHVAADQGRVDLPLICDWPNRPLQHVDHERGKPSQTDWQVLARGGLDVAQMAQAGFDLAQMTGGSHELQNFGEPIDAAADTEIAAGPTADPAEVPAAGSEPELASEMSGAQLAHWPVTRLQLTPLTGRSHQLRVHLQSLGHPILGDRFYAHDAALLAATRLQLHASSLTLRHPDDGRHCTFSVPCPF